MKYLIVSLIVNFGIWGIHAYHPFDLDDQGCREMFPNVYKKNATMLDITKTKAPYTLSPGSDRYDHDDNFYVTLRAEHGYLISAVFVQARPANCTIPDQTVSLGIFSVTPRDTFMTTANCNGKQNNVAISKHFDKQGIPLITLKWKPLKTEERTIYFVATVVSNSTEFWTQIFSEQVRYKNATGTRNFKHCPVKSIYTGDDEHKNKGSQMRSQGMEAIYFICVIFLSYISRC